MVSPELAKLMAAYQTNPSWGFQRIFREGVRAGGPSPDYGSGAGAAFQRLCKISPSFAVEAAAVGLRVIGGKAPHGHWGPIRAKKAELKPETDALFAQVQQIVEAAPTPSRPPIIVQPAPPTPQPSPVPPQVPDWVLADLLRRLQQLEKAMLGTTTPQPQVPAPPAGEMPKIDVAAISQLLKGLGQINTSLAGLRLPQSGNGSSTPILSPIDKALGGEAMVGLKTPLAILAYAGLWIMQAFEAVGPATGSGATKTAQVLTALIGAFGGLGLTAKIDRGIKAVNAIAAATQNLPPPSGQS